LVDLDGYFDVVVFSSLFKKCWQELRIGNAIVVKGRRSNNSKKSDKPGIVASQIYTMDEIQHSFVKQLELHVMVDELTDERLFGIKNILERYPGGKECLMFIKNDEEVIPMRLEKKVEITKELIDALSTLIDKESIKIGVKNI
ncbi:MAG: hypothetical protein B5M53_09385, partial [Candidatus Cloacimonas sp. 4484_209]